MRDAHLRTIDLNLLRSLQPLLEERHVSRAAKRAFLSRPAMSRALDRLRDAFGDPLLVRSGRELKPFPYFMTWHPRLINEPTHAWLRDQVRAVARSIRSK